MESEKKMLALWGTCTYKERNDLLDPCISGAEVKCSFPHRNKTPLQIIPFFILGYNSTATFLRLNIKDKIFVSTKTE